MLKNNGVLDGVATTTTTTTTTTTITTNVCGGILQSFHASELLYSSSQTTVC